MNIQNYDDFLNALYHAGFSMGGANPEGIFSIIRWDWKETAPYETKVSWHTGEPDYDPWEWRIRVLNDREDIAYGKFFFKKSGYITKEWYPCFLSCRRRNRSFEDIYSDGKISHEAKRIYECISEYGTLPLHELKKMAEFTKEEKSKFDKALIELQMMFFLTISGKRHKISLTGKDYGWDSTTFCKTEDFWPEDIFQQASALPFEDAYHKIREQILVLHPSADDKIMKKFILGNPYQLSN